MAAMLAFTTSALALTLQNAGFSATSYATGFASDGTGHGPLATAWEGNVLWAADAADGGLYRADAGGAPGPATALVAMRVNPVALSGIGGLALGLDGRLYAIVGASIVELSKIDGTVLRTLATSPSIPTPQRIATDPLTGDLIVTSQGGPSQSPRVWRIAQPATTAMASFYARITTAAYPTKAITIGPDGTIFVMSQFGLYWIESTAAAALHPGLLAAATPMSSAVNGITGLSVITDGVTTTPQFLAVTTSSGAVYKIPGVGAPSVDNLLVLDGAGAGADVSTGPDRCAYASLGAQVIRIADAGGTCVLASAGVTPPSLSLAATSGQIPRVGGAQQTLTATLTHAASLSGHAVTFTVTGANTFTRTVTTDAAGVAQFSYVSSVTGADTIVATGNADGFPMTSNAVVLDWQRQIDLAAPTVGFTYTVPSGGQGTSFACDTTITSATAHQVSCGWFTKAPTIHWVVTANGPSGLGTLNGCADYTLNYQPGAEGHHQTCSAVNGDGQSLTALTVVIDAVLSPPVVTPSATVGGLPYAGALTRGPVLVHFDCSASPIQPGLQCPADQSFAGTGTYTASGTATDIAGQTTTAAFGPFAIDTTPPSVSVDAGGYVFGSWTNHSVVLTFTCTDNVGTPSCSAPVTVAASDPGVSITSTDSVGNQTTFTTGAIKIDTTPPSISASAKNADGTPYTPGSLTNQSVIVHFTCAADAGSPITCPPDQTLAATGTATGTASDAAGNTASVSVDALIDKAAPQVTAAATVGGVAYDGTWTLGPVVVHFTCTDDTAVASCPADVTLSGDQNAPVTGSATDTAGNTASVTTAVIKIDRTGPVTTATVTGSSAGPGAYLFTATVGLAATDAGSGVASITYRVDGGAPVTVSGASASFIVNTAGAHAITYHSTDALGNAETDRTLGVTIVFRQRTALAITSAPFMATGGLVSASLTTDTGTPVGGETVSFTAGGVTRTAVTNAAGVASADLGLASGAYTLSSSYAGTTAYFPSDATAQPLTVYALSRFAVYAPNATLGATVQFYGGDWSKQIPVEAIRKGFADFKGYTDSSTSTAWTARSRAGNKPPKAIPQYIGVLLTTHASKGPKDVITGDVVGIAIVRVAGGDDDQPKKLKAYDGTLGDRGFGTVVGLGGS